jgi:hypothetical protein
MTHLTLRTCFNESLSETDPSIEYPTDEPCPDLLSRAFRSLNHVEPDGGVRFYLRVSDCPILLLLSDNEALNSTPSQNLIAAHILSDTPDSIPAIPLSWTKYHAPPERYERGDLLGRGSYGQVLRAFDRVKRQMVAYKSISCNCGGVPLSIARELRALTERYAALIARRDRAPARRPESHERSDLTALLLAHYGGDAGALARLRERFAWTDADLAPGERTGISRWIRKGARAFTGFRDLWTSWLIAASEG